MKEVVPDILCLPEVDLEGHVAEGFGEGEGHVEGGLGGQVVGRGCFEADHGALHALSGGVGELGGVEGHVVTEGSGEE